MSVFFFAYVLFKMDRVACGENIEKKIAPSDENKNMQRQAFFSVNK